MTGAELKKWRTQVGWKPKQLMTELGITSRQTLHNWENSEQIPRIAELAIIAIDQIEACRFQTGFEQQFTHEGIANRSFAKLKAINAEAEKLDV